MHTVNVFDDAFTVWYTSWRNRGYLSPQAVKRMPSAIVDERWKELSTQLLRYKKEPQLVKK